MKGYIYSISTKQRLNRQMYKGQAGILTFACLMVASNLSAQICLQFYDVIFAHHDVTQWFVKSWTAQLFLIVITTFLFWARRSHSEKLFGFENAFSSNLLHIPGSSARSNLDSNYKQITEEFFWNRTTTCCKGLKVQKLSTNTLGT